MNCFAERTDLERDIEDYMNGYTANPSPKVARLYLYHIFGSKYGWTPKEVDEMDYWVVRGLKHIIEVEEMNNRVSVNAQY